MEISMLGKDGKITDDDINFFSNIVNDINALSDTDTLSNSRQVRLGTLISKCCPIIKGKEITALSTEVIFSKLTDCKYSEQSYRPTGTSFVDTDYWWEVVKIAKEAKKYNSKFYLQEGVLYLLHKDLPFPGCVSDRETLLLGEKNFSFAYSYKITHENTKLIASEYELPGQGGKLIDFSKAIVSLLASKVIIAYGMDATKLHEYTLLKPHFRRIQFNCPYGTGNTEKKQLVHDFMASAKQLLHEKGKLHVSIQQPKEPNEGGWNKAQYQIDYGLPPSALTHQFELVKVMGDIKDRYNKKVSKIINDPKVNYVPFLGGGDQHRVNQFVFKHGADNEKWLCYGSKPDEKWFGYVTDDGTDSESDIASTPSKSGKKK